MNEVESRFLFFDDDDWPGGALFLVGVASTGTGLFLVGGGGLVCRSPRLFGRFVDELSFLVSFLFLFVAGLATAFFLGTGRATGFLTFSLADSEDELDSDLLSSAELSSLSSLLLLLSLDSLAPLSSALEFSSLLDSDDASLCSSEPDSSSTLDSSFSLSSSKNAY